jgi:hypothetical protein
MTDDPLVSTTSIDTVTIDPNNHNTIYAGTGDLNYGSFSMGSQGILKSTDAGATWTVLGADVFGIAYPVPPASPQYQAVGKVRVDPLNSNIVAAGTKTGLYLSYDGGVNWTGPCLTNPFPTQRQDITALELTDVGGSTRILAAVGVRGFATTVQYDLGQNGANGIYSAHDAGQRLPELHARSRATPTASSSDRGRRQPVRDRRAHERRQRHAVRQHRRTGNQLGRIDIAVAPSNPNVIYAQVQSIAPTTTAAAATPTAASSACGHDQRRRDVELHGGSAAARSRVRDSAGIQTGSGDYPQNWYDQAVAVDPNNATACSSARSTSGSHAHRHSFNNTTCATATAAAPTGARRPARAGLRAGIVEHPGARQRRRDALARPTRTRRAPARTRRGSTWTPA